MHKPIPIFLVAYVLALTLLTATDRAAGETVTDGRGIQCIPDVAASRENLASRRGARFIAYLSQTGDKYIRNSDYRCLHQQLKPFDYQALNTREAKYLLLYRIISQLGQGQYVGAHIELDWLNELRHQEEDHEFDLLMENKIQEVSGPGVNNFQKAIARNKYTTIQSRIERTPDMPGTARAESSSDSILERFWQNHFSSPYPKMHVLQYLIYFASQRILHWDYLTLKRCADAVNPYDLNPAERLYLYSIQVIANLELGNVADAYAAFQNYNELAVLHPDAALTEAYKNADDYPFFTDGITYFYTITKEKLDSAFAGVCQSREIAGHTPQQLFAFIAKIETDALTGGKSAKEWLCAKKQLEQEITEEAFYQTIPRNEIGPLFLLAKSNLKMGDYKTAHRQLAGLKMHSPLKDTAYAEPVERMLRDSGDIIQTMHAASFKDKLTDMTELFYYSARNRFVGIALTGALLIYFFLQWQQYFRECGSGLLSFAHAVGRLPQLQQPSQKLVAWMHHRRKPTPDLKPVFSEKEINLQEPFQNEFAPGNRIGITSALWDRSHDMVKRLSMRAPYPLSFIARMPGYLPRRHFWYYTTTGFLLSLIATWVFSFGKPMPLMNKALLFFLLAATLIAALTGIRIMTRQMLRCLREIATMLESPGDLIEIETEAMAMFRSPWQFYVAFIIYGLFFTVSDTRLPSSHLVVILIILTMSPIHWMMISSLLFTRVLCDMHNLSINPLSPLKTWGLQKWVAVIGTFATTGSVIITFASSIPIMINWDNLTGRDLFWICAMLPPLLVYWVYPYFRIRNLVRRFKLARMHFIKTHMSHTYDSWQSLAGDTASIQEANTTHLKNIEDQMDRLNRYYDLFKVVDRSPEFFVDVYSIMELAKVMGFPSLFALLVSLMRLL